MSGSGENRHHKSKDLDFLKSLLFVGLLVFYLANFAGFLIGLTGFKFFGNLESLFLLLVSVFGLNVLVGLPVKKLERRLS